MLHKCSSSINYLRWKTNTKYCLIMMWDDKVPGALRLLPNVVQLGLIVALLTVLLTFSFCSGAEDKHGYIWDRHYNICLARLAHDDVVNSVAFSPADQELLLSASDDSTIKVWRSPRMVRLAQASPRQMRPRSLLPSWLLRHKNSTLGGSVNGKTASEGWKKP